MFSAVNNANVADVWQTRIAYLFKPNENFSALVTYYHQDDKTQGVQADSPYFQGGSVDYPPSQNPFYSPSYPVSFPTGGVVFPANGTYVANDGVLPINHRKADLGTVDLSVGFGFATLSSSTSYYQDKGSDVSDGSPFIAKTPGIYGFMPRVVDYEEDFDTQKAGRLIAGYVDDLSNWYVRRSRRRFWAGDPAALATPHECLQLLTLVLAPITPFITERVWQDLFAPCGAVESAHLAAWPKADGACR